MDKVIIVVIDGMVKNVYTTNKDVDIEVIDFDRTSLEDKEIKILNKRLDIIETSTKYTKHIIK